MTKVSPANVASGAVSRLTGNEARCSVADDGVQRFVTGVVYNASQPEATYFNVECGEIAQREEGEVN